MPTQDMPKRGLTLVIPDKLIDYRLRSEPDGVVVDFMTDGGPLALKISDEQRKRLAADLATTRS